MIKKFKKCEKKTCKHYEWGKCLEQGRGKDCKPLTKDGLIPDSIQECRLFEINFK